MSVAGRWVGRVIVGLVGVCAVGTTVASAAVDFAPRQMIRTGALTIDVAVGDLNGDGRVDLAALPVQLGVVPVFGSGGGVFTPGPASTMGNAALAFELADVNRDGTPDVVAVNTGANAVSVLLGNGAGGFAAPAVIGVGKSPNAIAMGDLNADTNPDFVVTNVESANLSILIGTGDGTFTVTAATAGTTPFGSAIGDLNRDGKADIVVTDATRRPGVVVLIGNGDGTFGATPLRSSLPGVFLPTSVAIGDLNRDGVPDVATANFGTNDVSVVHGIGNGLFVDRGRLNASTSPGAIVIADLNADGLLDIATTNADSDDVTVLEGQAIGFAPGKQFVVGRGPGYLRAADLTGDGRVDLVVATSGGALAVLASHALVPGTTGTAKGIVGCAKPRRIVVSEAIACVTVGMSRAQVKELLGKATGRRASRLDGTDISFYGRRQVIFPAKENVAIEVRTERRGDTTTEGVAVGGAASLIKKRYPKAKCQTRGGELSCFVRKDGLDTDFFARNGRIYAIAISYGG